MPCTTIELLDRDPITLESALKKNENIVLAAVFAKATEDLYNRLWEAKYTIAVLVKQHLRLPHADVTVFPPREWMRGSFNICVPVRIQTGNSSQKVILRCSMPFKLGQAMDEKLGSEVGAYAWMQEHCPGIRLPHLYGFGFSDHRHVR